MVSKQQKAVRDKIPEIIKASGRSCDFTILDDTSFLREMEIKLREEGEEYAKDKTIDELVDIIEVAYRIAELKGFDNNAIEQFRREKTLKKGKFSKNIFVWY